MVKLNTYIWMIMVLFLAWYFVYTAYFMIPRPMVFMEVYYPYICLLILVTGLFWIYGFGKLVSGSSYRRIRSGKNAPEKHRWPLWYEKANEVVIKRRYTFTERSVYDFHDNDQYDRNKLFGLGFRMWPKIIRKTRFEEGMVAWFKIPWFVVIKPGNWSCAMVTWRYDPKEGVVKVYAYVRRSGIRRFVGGVESGCLHAISIGKPHTIEMRFNKKESTVDFNIKNGDTDTRLVIVEMRESQKLFWYLDAWFGGNREAPVDVIYYEEAIK